MDKKTATRMKWGALLHKVLDTSRTRNRSSSMETQEQDEKPKTKWDNYTATRRTDKSKKLSYRRGPAPVEEVNLKSEKRETVNGTIDSDVDEINGMEEEGSVMGTPVKRRMAGHQSSGTISEDSEKGTRIASCKALLIYFSKIGKSYDEHDEIDLNFLSALMECGADINISDKHGQTVLHEVARAWHTDVARFVCENGGDVNKPDEYGRTPLHVASIVNYPEMVELLIMLGANIDARTKGEDQSPIHYAAKNNAIASLKVLLKLGANLNDRDYKNRTPIYLAAENARPEAAHFLLDYGAPVGVYDDSGTSCYSLMIAKMPNIAMEAVEQFHHLDLAFRKHYFFLSYLEPDPTYLEPEPPKSKREQMYEKEKKKDLKKTMKEEGIRGPKKRRTFAKVPLEVIVQYNQIDLLTHPVFQRLISVKWNLFGKFNAGIMATINLFYTLLWTALGFTLPDDRKYYTPLKSRWWRLALDILGVLLTLFFILKEISSLKESEKNYTKWRIWRTKQVERDAKFCHPRWPEDKNFIDAEIEQIRSYKRTYFRQGWNIFEWFSYLCILLLIITRAVEVFEDSSKPNATEGVVFNVHTNAFPCVLLIIWLRFMRSCRPFKSLGVFIAILSHVIVATLKFAFLFFEFYIPYVAAFWIMFGGDEHAKLMGKHAINWRKFNDLLYSVWQIFVGDSFNLAGLVAVDRLMAQILAGTYLALAGLVCFNLYIALLSQTFTDAYGQAQATASMQQATVIISVEKNLPKKQKIKFGHYMQKECSPLEVYTLTEGHTPKDQHNMLFDKIIRHSSNRILQFEENLEKNLKSITTLQDRRVRRKGHGAGMNTKRHDRNPHDHDDDEYVELAAVLPLIEERTKRLENLERILNEFKKTIQEELGKLPNGAQNGSEKTLGSIIGKFKGLKTKDSAEKEDTSKAVKIGQQRSSRRRYFQWHRYVDDDLEMRDNKGEIDLVNVLKAKALGLLGIDSYSPEKAENVASRKTKKKPRSQVNHGYEEEGRARGSRWRNERGRKVVDDDNVEKETSSEYEEEQESKIKTWLKQKHQ